MKGEFEMLFDLLFLIFLIVLLLSTITCSVFCFKVVSRELITFNRNTK